MAAHVCVCIVYLKNLGRQPQQYMCCRKQGQLTPSHHTTWRTSCLQGTLCCGVSGRLTPLPHKGKPLLHPLVARLEQQLSSAALLGPPPPPVPPLELPLPPRFRRK